MCTVKFYAYAWLVQQESSLVVRFLLRGRDGHLLRNAVVREDGLRVQIHEAPLAALGPERPAGAAREVRADVEGALAERQQQRLAFPVEEDIVRLQGSVVLLRARVCVCVKESERAIGESDCARSCVCVTESERAIVMVKVVHGVRE